MKIKVADYIADFMVVHGLEHVFTVTGGGAMHLNDAFGHKKELKCIYNHHEQACAMAAEGYTRLSNKLALVCVTSGPGGTNAITGILGGWLDSIPMFVISGQVKRETTTWSTDIPLRQLGDQEFNITESVKNMTKYAEMITEPTEIRYHMEKAFYLALNGRPGPVWLDIPLDIQASIVETEELQGYHPTAMEELQQNPFYDQSITPQIFEKIACADRPVILAGTGIRLADAYDDFLILAERLNIPVVTEWNAHDLLWKDHPCFCGKPGTLGTRGGNFVIQNCDLLLVLGSRMNIRMISYNKHQFAQNAYKIVVDIDENELKKPTIKVDMPIHANIKDVLRSMNNFDYPIKNTNHKKWLKWCKKTDALYPATLPYYYDIPVPMNPYAFMTEFFAELDEGDEIICGNGSACVITFQTCDIKKNQRLFTNSGCAAMGYGFPAAIGGCVARNGKRIICLDGDGSFQMNMQELQTVVYHRLNLKLFYLNNNGYHSIRQTQSNLFAPPLVGVCAENGLSFPEAERVAYAYQVPYIKIDDIREARKKVQLALETEGPIFCEVIVDPKQNFVPKLSSKVLPDGSITSPEIDDMYPFLEREEYMSIKGSVDKIKS